MTGPLELLFLPVKEGDGETCFTGAFTSGTCSMAGALFSPSVADWVIVALSADFRVDFTAAATCSWNTPKLVSLLRNH